MSNETCNHAAHDGADPEAALLDALARGDCAPFWQYWILHHQAFLGLCVHWLGGDRHDAEEVLSTGALKVIEHLYGKSMVIRSFRAWLLRILRNLCVDVLRERQRRADLPAPALDGDEDLRPVLALDSGERPDRDLYRRTLRGTLVDSLRLLPPPLRDAFVLRFIEELSYQEISLRLCISAPNARKRIQQARALLQCRLEPPG